MQQQYRNNSSEPLVNTDYTIFSYDGIELYKCTAKPHTMKKSIILSIVCLFMGGSILAQSPRGIQRRSNTPARTNAVKAKTDKQVKRDINKGGHLNNGDNGDKHNSRGRGDKNNH